jgi:hypothetical protein
MIKRKYQAMEANSIMVNLFRSSSKYFVLPLIMYFKFLEEVTSIAPILG